MNVSIERTVDEHGRRLPEARLRSARSLVLILCVALLAASCARSTQDEAHGPNHLSGPIADARPGPDIAAGTAAAEEGSIDSARPLRPQVFPGSGVMIAAPAIQPVSHVDAGADGIGFDFVNADVRDVAREILGEQLHLGYVVDSKVQATITAQTGGPLPHNAVLPTLDAILRSNGLGLVETNGIYRILPAADAAKAGFGAPAVPHQPGYGIRVLPLHYVSAAELKGVLQPMLPPGGGLQVDPMRNLLIVSGPSADLDGIQGLVRQFDVDWLKGTSFAIYPLQVGLAKDIATELQAVFGDGGTGPLAGLVRIVPLDRLNAILVISPQRSYLSQVKTWIDRFDLGEDQMTPRLFEYRVQNSRAADLAAVLTKLLSSGMVSTVQPEIAPGAKTAELMSQQATMTTSPTGTAAPPPPTPGGLVPSAAPSAAPPGAANPPSPYGAAAQTPLRSQVAQRASDVLSGTEGGFGGTENALSPPPVRVVADEKNNALVIYARPRDYRMIEDVIHRLDVVPYQVLIEATIAEVTLNDELSYGLQFFLKSGASRFSLTSPTTPPTPPTNGIGAPGDITAVFPGFNYVLSTASARAILSALSSISHVDVISSPQILVLDHQTAALQVGDQVPIITQSSQSVITPNAPILNSIEYRSTGVVLRVTPRVNTSGLITLDIDQEVSDVAKTTTSNIDSPTITERRIVSSVVVQDGQTVALGGLILDNQQTTRTGIPILSDIPGIGALFRGTTHTNARTELLVLLTPKIIKNGEDARAMTEELRDRMRTLKPLESRIR